MNVDVLIHGRWVIPMDAADRVLEHHAIAVTEGRIVGVLPSAQAEVEISAQRVHRLDGHALLPGFINAHTHAAMSLFKGLADDLPLMDWLNNHIWPAESRWVNPEFIADGSRLAIAEMIRSGTTCFNDMYFFPDITAEVAAEAGIRATVGLIVIDFPTAWAKDTREYFDKGLAVHDSFRHHPLIRTAFAPHAPYTVSDEPLQRVAVLAEELDIPVHMHVHETAFEVSQAIEQNGVIPLQRLADLGLLGQRLLAVHMTCLDTAMIEMVARHNVNIVHCPQSNLKLASGICPVQALIEHGVNVTLGTDGAASNNDLDMLDELRTAALLGKGSTGNPEAIPAMTALKMATINAARALDLDRETGSLEPGKSADLIAVDLDRIETRPVYDPVSTLVYAAGRDQISDVWVAGRQLLADRQLTTLDARRLLTSADQWRDRIRDA